MAIHSDTRHLDAESHPFRSRHRRNGSIAVFAILVGFVGCGAPLMPTPNLIIGEGRAAWADVPLERQTTTADVLYATDRQPENDDDEPLEYGSGRFNRLAYGVATFRFSEKSWDDLLDQSTTASRPRSTTLKLTELREIDRFPATPWPVRKNGNRAAWSPEVMAEHDAAVGRFRELIRQRLALTAKKEVVVYIHGAANGFEESVGDSAQLWHFLGRRGVPITYSWPTNTGVAVRGYNYDRESGEFTVFHLKQFIVALAGAPGLGKIHFIAHSRGTDVLMSALRELNIEYAAKHDGKPAATATALRIGHVVLFAADIDFSVAQQRLEAEAITEACEHLTVYSSRADLALRFANWLFSSTVRLGTLGLVQLPKKDRTKLAGIHNLTLIDVNVLSGFIGHSYFYSSPSVSSDLILLLRDDLEPGADAGRPLIRKNDAFWELRDGYPATQKQPDNPE